MLCLFDIYKRRAQFIIPQLVANVKWQGCLIGGLYGGKIQNGNSSQREMSSMIAHRSSCRSRDWRRFEVVWTVFLGNRAITRRSSSFCTWVLQIFVSLKANFNRMKSWHKSPVLHRSYPRGRRPWVGLTRVPQALKNSSPREKSHARTPQEWRQAALA